MARLAKVVQLCLTCQTYFDDAHCDCALPTLILIPDVLFYYAYIDYVVATLTQRSLLWLHALTRRGSPRRRRSSSSAPLRLPGGGSGPRRRRRDLPLPNHYPSTYFHSTAMTPLHRTPRTRTPHVSPCRPRSGRHVRRRARPPARAAQRVTDVEPRGSPQLPCSATAPMLCLRAVAPSNHGHVPESESTSRSWWHRP